MTSGAKYHQNVEPSATNDKFVNVKIAEVGIRTIDLHVNVFTILPPNPTGQLQIFHISIDYPGPKGDV